MKFSGIFLVFALALNSNANPIVIRDGPPPANATYVPCLAGTKDPICLAIKGPSPHVYQTTFYPNGTKETKRSNYTRAQLKALRDAQGIKSIEHKPGNTTDNGSDEHVMSLIKRISGPSFCGTATRQDWYDTHEQGYWYQEWKQVGHCFYCDNTDCSETFSNSFSVAQTWTVGLSVTFNEIIQTTFGYSYGQTYTIQDARTCSWKANTQSSCHSIWYQPAMYYHNGYANYQTVLHCPNGDRVYNHNWAYANVNNAAGSPYSSNQGNLGCGSGCGGNDHRQCYGNSGGSLWPYPNT